MDTILEVCCGSWQSAVAAAKNGAQRIELCQALSVDGLTPSMGLLSRLRERFPALRIHILIRTREGDFVYDEDEVAIMEADIREAAKAGADGIVCGALTADGDVDTAAMRRWMEAAQGLPVTFHRAFDHVREPRQALEQLVALGVARVLTTGGRMADGTIAKTAEEGIPALRELVLQAAGRIIIMPGCGVTNDNARKIIEATGVRELHGTKLNQRIWQQQNGSAAS